MFEHAEELRIKLRETQNPIIIQLAELLEMQQVLDLAIYKEHNIKKYPLHNKRIALVTELGEMFNEIPSVFKYWKKTAEDNRDKALEEYVDALHFALSLTNYYAEDYLNMDTEELNYRFDYYRASLNSYGFIEPYSTAAEVSISLARIIGREMEFKKMAEIGGALGFYWEEIYNAYKEKNEINYQRLKEGY